MMKNSFVIVSGKGGVGKSTTTVALGKIFARKGLKTLLIDCDAGLSSLDVLLNITDKKLFNWYDVYYKRCTAQEALCEADKNLSVVFAPDSTVKEEAPDAISALASELADSFDMLLIDSPAGLGAGFERACRGARNALVIATADAVCVKDAALVEASLKKHGLSSVRMLVNRYDIKAAKNGYYLTVDELIDRSYVQLLGIIPEDKELMYQSVKQAKKTKGKSGEAYLRIANRMLGQREPLKLSKLK